MPEREAIYVEAGSKRVFAGALDRPGWCRSGRDEPAALAALVEYGPRYASAVKKAAKRFALPGDVSALKVVERFEGDATTDFGAPGVAPAADSRPLDNEELERLIRILESCWAAFDAAARAHADAELRKGPRGGGRDLPDIVSHVLDADGAYVARLGHRFHAPEGVSVGELADGLREAMVRTLRARARGEPPEPSRAKRPAWTPRYTIRRSAWHALDHTWEIEDRATPA